MVVAPAPLLIVVAARPHGEADRLVRVFVKRLLEELRTRQAVMHRSVTGAIPACACSSVAASQRVRSVPKAAARRGAQTAPAPGKLAKSSWSGVVGEDRRNLCVEGVNGLEQARSWVA